MDRLLGRDGGGTAKGQGVGSEILLRCRSRFWDTHPRSDSEQEVSLRLNCRTRGQWSVYYSDMLHTCSLGERQGTHSVLFLPTRRQILPRRRPQPFPKLSFSGSPQV